MLGESSDEVNEMEIAYNSDGSIREVTEKDQRSIPELGEQFHTG